jgi:hypothetical protein
MPSGRILNNFIFAQQAPFLIISDVSIWLMEIMLVNYLADLLETIRFLIIQIRIFFLSLGVSVHCIIEHC